MKKINPKIRYFKQKDLYSCGPVSIMNALKWAGHEFSAKKYLAHYQKALNCCNPIGVFPETLDEYLKSMDELKVINITNQPTLKQLDAELDSGRAAILAYRFRSKKRKNYGGHYSLCVGRTPKTYYLVNDRKKCKTLSRYPRKSVELLLKTTETSFKPASVEKWISCMWSIEAV